MTSASTTRITESTRAMIIKIRYAFARFRLFRFLVPPQANTMQKIKPISGREKSRIVPK